MSIHAARESFTAPRRQPTQAQVEAARLTLLDENVKISTKSFAIDTIWLSENPILDFKSELQVIRLGNTYIYGLPGEIYSCIGLTIKSNSPSKNNFVVQLANDTIGYVVPEPELSGGAYEGRLAKYTAYTTADTCTYLEKQSVILADKLK